MPTSHSKVINIKQQPEQKTLSKAQKQFNALIKKIDAQKKLLIEWKDTLPMYQQKVSGEYEPLMDAHENQRIALARLLDRAHDDSQFKKRDKEKLRHIITDLVDGLAQSHGEVIKDLYNKYSEVDFDTQAEELESMSSDFMKTMAQEMFGVDIPEDADLNSPEKIAAFLKDKMANDAQQEHNHNRQKSAKQLQREATQEKEAEKISKSIQEVYRTLVKTLHPDREPDLAERERKTELMQRVNIAYGKKDLLQLLELQLEIEQIDQTQLNNIAEERLKYFNKILKGQLEELVQEIAEIEMPFKMNMSYPPHLTLRPSEMMRFLQLDIQSLKSNIRNLKTELDAFKDFTFLKRWLKEYKIPKPAYFEEQDMINEMEMMFGDLGGFFK